MGISKKAAEAWMTTTETTGQLFFSYILDFPAKSTKLRSRAGALTAAKFIYNRLKSIMLAETITLHPQLPWNRLC